MKFPGSPRVRITDPAGVFWFATSLLHRPTPEGTIKFLNNQARLRGVRAEYALATEEEYQAYRDEVRAVINSPKA